MKPSSARVLRYINRNPRLRRELADAIWEMRRSRIEEKRIRREYEKLLEENDALHEMITLAIGRERLTAKQRDSLKMELDNMVGEL